MGAAGEVGQQQVQADVQHDEEHRAHDEPQVGQGERGQPPHELQVIGVAQVVALYVSPIKARHAGLPLQLGQQFLLGKE